MCIPTHPGETIKDEIGARGLSATRLAMDLGVPVSRLTAIINGKRSISVDTAMRLGLCFGNGARFWLARQVHYDLAIAEIERGAEIARTVRVAA